ncbi:MAG: RNA polymerase sigma factor [Acidimicrobiales bacterium]
MTSVLVDTDTGFEQFYREHRDQIARALALATGNADLGAEAADEAMARALARWDSLDAMRNPAGWVYRVGLNWVRSSLRRRRHAPVVYREAAAADASGIGDTTLDRALAALPLIHRSVVVCRYLLDWSVEDTARALGISPGTVKSRLNRALAKLRHELKEDA